MIRKINSKGAVLVEAAIALAIFVPIFLIFSALLLKAAIELGNRGASAAYSQSPCEIENNSGPNLGKLIDPITRQPADWCI